MSHRITQRLSRLLHRPQPPRRAQTMGGRKTDPGPPPSIPDWYRMSWSEQAAAEGAARWARPTPPPDPSPPPVDRPLTDREQAEARWRASVDWLRQRVAFEPPKREPVPCAWCLRGWHPRHDD